MADENWKKRTGVNINYSSEDEGDDGIINSDDSCKDPSSSEEDSFDALMRDFEQFGQTPPRTRILRRDQSWEKKKKPKGHSGSKSAGKVPVVSRYRKSNSDVMMVNGTGAMELEEELTQVPKKLNKRIMQKLRGFERDLKLNIDISRCCVKEERSESLPTFKVESSNRFMSLSCKLVKSNTQQREVPECTKTRSDFHDACIAVLKSGNSENKERTSRRQLSREEHLWQTELQELIWLELQAWRAGRTPTQQDAYIFEARNALPSLLHDILNYRFEKKQSTHSSDSGIHLPSPEIEAPCQGCLWLFCPSCMEHENTALREVEGLMARLEAAEALYPSSKAFASHYTLYMSHEFIARVKAMCLWYNVTRHHRLKLLILGKQLLSYAQGNDPDEAPESFDIYKGISCSESVNSTYDGDFYNTQAITTMGRYLHQLDSGDTRNYRQYIEDVLKVKGLRKALYFLENLHIKVLRKARIALEKPVSSQDTPVEDDNDENELRRYGFWSPEAQSLNLPSFRPAFLFISRVPLDVIHEFLRMRLETKMEKPSALSIRQLMKELKEGLRLSVLNKQRYLQHVMTALQEEDEETQNKFTKYVIAFDENVQSVFNLYLSYLEQWVQLTQQVRVQKDILEEEWKFVTSAAPHIPGGLVKAGSVFCKMATSMLCTICDEMKDRVNQLTSEFLDVSVKHSILALCRELQTLSLETRNRAFRVTSLAKTLSKYLEAENLSSCEEISGSLEKFKGEAWRMCESLRSLILVVEETMTETCLEEKDNLALQSRYREVLHQMYKFAFEYYREVCRLTPGEFSPQFARGMIDFSQQWLKFVCTLCEKGRGSRPRWANCGLEFLACITNPKFTNNLSDEEFEDFKKTIECGMSHIMGTRSENLLPSVLNTPPYLSTRTRSSSPSPSVMKTKLSFSSGPDTPPSSLMNGESDKPPTFGINQFTSNENIRQDRIVSAITELDSELDKKLKNSELIGTVVITHNERSSIRPRRVNFSWQRGIKIGQGRFGKVYTAVNIDTGELLAMKEISLQPNDVGTIKSVALEMKIFEGIQHDHLVRYYGTEIHREELLIFMELCTEGTLESLVAATEAGLPEGLVRRYTSQLLNAISALHSHSIVHRDIKSANIFLTSEGNCLKLGDFGSAVKIKAHTTIPGELRAFVGTLAYMAPEVFMKNTTVGHGRAVDIWSLGCVIIEMASGKRPWSEFDSNCQIIFKVGMGEIPGIPSILSEEGRHFVAKCLQHNPKQRFTAKQLQHHTFLKIDSEEDCLSCTMPSILEDYLKLGIKR